MVVANAGAGATAAVGAVVGRGLSMEASTRTCCSTHRRPGTLQEGWGKGAGRIDVMYVVEGEKAMKRREKEMEKVRERDDREIAKRNEIALTLDLTLAYPLRN